MRVTSFVRSCTWILLAARLGAEPLAAQQPLFTFAQVSDSQPQSTTDNQRFVDVLRTIAEAGDAGALLPRPVDLVLFAGDITSGNTRSEWVAATQKLDTWLTANDIPYLAVPGNHDVDGSDTSLYEEFITSSNVWDAGSASFTGHNGPSRTTGWSGLRFIGLNNSNPGWNTVSGGDLSVISARVAAAHAAGENVFFLCHHPHNEKARVPLAGLLPNPSVVGYLHGHSGSPHVTHGLAGVSNANVWDVDTNAIYQDGAIVYFEVFATELRAHVIELRLNPSSLPAPRIVPLVHALQPAGGGNSSLVTFTSSGDARVSESNPNGNFGLETTLRVKSQSGSSAQSFLSFDLTGLTGDPLSARLRLFCTDDSSNGGRVYLVPSSWTETGVTWSSRPALPASSLATLGAVDVNRWIEVDVLGAVSGPGPLSLALAGGSSNTAGYSSRQGAHPPELVIEIGADAPLTVDLAASPLSGPAPLSVSFTALSSGATAYLWDFGDGGTSSERDPVHVYSAPGSYTVSLQVSDASESATRVRADLITVGSGTGTGTLTLLPLADARVNEANPGSNYGSDPLLRVRAASGGSYHSYLRFDLAGLSGPVVEARLRLFSSDGSDVAGRVFATAGSWSEAGLTWSNKPAPTGALITSTGTVATGAWAEFDVTSAVVAGGTLDLVLQSSSSNSCYYSSREGAHPPELVVSTQAP